MGSYIFSCKKGIFYGSNNGAHCLDVEEYRWFLHFHQSEFFSLHTIDDGCDIVHMATPCMENGDDLDKYSLADILKQAAKDI